MFAISDIDQLTINCTVSSTVSGNKYTIGSIVKNTVEQLIITEVLLMFIEFY